MRGLKIARIGPSISFLFFVDDSLVFCKETLEEVRKLMQILGTYQKAPGQIVNFKKDKIAIGSRSTRLYE